VGQQGVFFSRRQPQEAAKAPGIVIAQARAGLELDIDMIVFASWLRRVDDPQ
jgi:hypothetical protein